MEQIDISQAALARALKHEINNKIAIMIHIGNKIRKILNSQGVQIVEIDQQLERHKEYATKITVIVSQFHADAEERATPRKP